MVKQELLTYIGDDATLLDVDAIHSAGYDVIAKAGKFYVYGGTYEVK